jgi:hypothetical protein
VRELGTHLCVERAGAATSEETENYKAVVVGHQPVQVGLPDGFWTKNNHNLVLKLFFK